MQVSYHKLQTPTCIVMKYDCSEIHSSIWNAIIYSWPLLLTEINYTSIKFKALISKYIKRKTVVCNYSYMP